MPSSSSAQTQRRDWTGPRCQSVTSPMLNPAHQRGMCFDDTPNSRYSVSSRSGRIGRPRRFRPSLMYRESAERVAAKARSPSPAATGINCPPDQPVRSDARRSIEQSAFQFDLPPAAAHRSTLQRAARPKESRRGTFRQPTRSRCWPAWQGLQPADMGRPRPLADYLTGRKKPTLVARWAILVCWSLRQRGGDVFLSTARTQAEPAFSPPPAMDMKFTSGSSRTSLLTVVGADIASMTR